MKRIVCLLALLAVCVLPAQTKSFKVGPAHVYPDGSFAVEGQKFTLCHYTSDWRLTEQGRGTVLCDEGYPRIENGKFLLRGTFRTGGGNFPLEETVSPSANGSEVEISCGLMKRTDGKNAPRLLFFRASVSAREFAGRPIRYGAKRLILPERFQKLNLMHNVAPGTVFQWNKSSGAGSVKVTSDGITSLIDARERIPEFQFRFCFGPGLPAKLRFRVESLTSGSRPVSIRFIANRGFADRIQGDGKGGWTDQGPTNDLAMLPTGLQHWGGIDFDIVRPSENQGKSCLVMPQGCELRRVLKFDKPVSARRFYLLHTMAWIAKPGILVGKLTFRHPDGSATTHEVRSGRDSNDWWNPQNTDNGRVVWTYDKGRFRIGLTVSEYDTGSKPVLEVEFRSFRESCWMVVALSSGDRALPPALDFEPTVIRAGTEYRPMKFERDVIPGSVLDFSFLLDPPAGKYGFVRNRGGRFSFENAPEKSIRFFGTNFCMLSSFPDKKTAELVAARLAAYGINAVRITHADGVMCENQKFSFELNPVRMDQLDYFVFKLKERGIYLTVDFFCSRPVRKGEIPGVSGKIDPWNGEFKVLALLDPEARKNYLRAVHRFMHHRNPYTKLAYKDEPAIFCAVLINEDNLDHWLKYSNSREVSRRFERIFQEYLEKNKSPDLDRGTARLRCIAEIHRNSYLEISNALRADGVRTLLFDQNMRNWPRTTFMRRDYDIVDNHTYFDHPTGAMPSLLKNKSVLDCFVTPAVFGASRIYGKPFLITEFNWCYPNRFRRESGVLMGACAALQDWSGLFRFCYAHPLQSLTRDSRIIAFETNNDPIALLSDRIGALLFVRGDLKTAKSELTLSVSPSALDSEAPYPDSIAPLCWLAKIGSSISAPPSAGTLNPFKPDQRKAAAFLADKGKTIWSGAFVRSETGEIELDAKNETFRAITPRTEVLIRNDIGLMTGNRFQAKTDISPALLCAASVDGKPLDQSAWAAVFHLTDVLNDGDVFSDLAMRIYKSAGKLPHLLKHGRAELTLRMRPGLRYAVYAVGFSGRRLARLPAECRPNGAVSFTADTACVSDGISVYEIVAE